MNFFSPTIPGKQEKLIKRNQETKRTKNRKAHETIKKSKKMKIDMLHMEAHIALHSFLEGIVFSLIGIIMLHVVYKCTFHFSESIIYTSDGSRTMLHMVNNRAK